MSLEKRQLTPIPDEIYEHIHVCGLCGYVHESWKKFCRHIIYRHRISYRQYVVRTRYGDVWPKCHCGCGANAYVGISLRRVGQPVYASACWKRLKAERTSVSRRRSNLTLSIRTHVVNHPLWRQEHTALGRAMNEREIIDDLHATGTLSDDDADVYRTLLSQRIHRLENEDRRRSEQVAAEATRIARSRKRTRRQRASDVQLPPEDLVPAHLQLGLDEEELWKMAEKASNA